jgi:hypothetical protein
VIAPTDDWRQTFSIQLPVHRATVFANLGPTSITRMNRAICMAMTVPPGATHSRATIEPTFRSTMRFAVNYRPN